MFFFLHFYEDNNSLNENSCYFLLLLTCVMASSHSTKLQDSLESVQQKQNIQNKKFVILDFYIISIMMKVEVV